MIIFLFPPLTTACVLQEMTANDGTHSISQIIVKMRQDRWNDAPATLRLTSDEIPRVTVGEADVRVLVGTYGGITSPAQVSGMPDLLLLRVTVLAVRGQQVNEG